MIWCRLEMYFICSCCLSSARFFLNFKIVSVAWRARLKQTATPRKMNAPPIMSNETESLILFSSHDFHHLFCSSSNTPFFLKSNILLTNKITTFKYELIIIFKDLLTFYWMPLLTGCYSWQNRMNKLVEPNGFWSFLHCNNSIQCTCHQHNQ